MPSATTNSPSPAWWLSSFCVRSCPSCVTAPHLSVAITLFPSLRLEHGVADLDAISHLDRAPLGDARAVEVRPVARREVVHDDAAVGELDPRMVTREVGVVGDHDRVVRLAADADHTADRVRRAAAVLRFQDDEPPGHAAAA